MSSRNGISVPLRVRTASQWPSIALASEDVSAASTAPLLRRADVRAAIWINLFMAGFLRLMGLLTNSGTGFAPGTEPPVSDAGRGHSPAIPRADPVWSRAEWKGSL